MSYILGVLHDDMINIKGRMKIMVNDYVYIFNAKYI